MGVLGRTRIGGIKANSLTPELGKNLRTIAFQNAGDSVLKGHGFSRAERHRMGMERALASEGRSFEDNG
jgi:hypothetical protein